jgi:hypothetical protein
MLFYENENLRQRLNERILAWSGDFELSKEIQIISMKRWRGYQTRSCLARKFSAEPSDSEAGSETKAHRGD